MLRRENNIASHSKEMQKCKFEELRSRQQPPRTDPSMVLRNLSSRPLLYNELKVLSRWLKFTTVPRQVTYNTIIVTMEATCKKLRSEKAKQATKEVSNALYDIKLLDHNIDKHRRRGTSDLRREESIVISPANKGNVKCDSQKILDMNPHTGSSVKLHDEN